MIELRADGSMPGAPQVARIYKSGSEGRLYYTAWAGEFETDLPAYLEKYDSFRGWVSDFIPYSGALDRLAELRAQGFTGTETEAEKLRHLKDVLLKARDAAEKAAATYFGACPVGPERIWASNVFDNIRNATRDA